MSEDTATTDKKTPNPQKIKWKNLAYYDTYDEADKHRKNIEQDTICKVRRCGPRKSKYVVKVGILIKELDNG